MIITFHVALLEVWDALNKYQETETHTIANPVIYTGTSKYCVHGVTFEPPIYMQRQEAVYKVINDFNSYASVKKIVDFGCGRFDYFKLFKSLSGVEEILEIDANEELLCNEHSRIAPTAGDFLTRRKVDLKVKVLQGSISDLDSRLLDTDIVVCVEVIEHLYPETLESVPYTVFGFMKPQMAIFTTPNRDINILFDMQTPFRDEDHKFEWSRLQFKCWGNNIVQRYTEYEVSFYGIGKGPEGTESLGCCSQMALFRRKLDAKYIDYERQEELLIYKVIAEYHYLANGQEEEGKGVLEEVWEIIHHMDFPNEELDSNLRVPLSLLHSKLKSNSPTISELQQILENGMWKVRECSGDIYVFPYAESSDTDDDSERDCCENCLPDVELQPTECYENSWNQFALEDQWDVENWESAN